MAITEWIRHESVRPNWLRDTVSILIVPNVLAGLGGALSGGRTRRLAARFHLALHDQRLGHVRRGLFGHLHSQLSRIHDNSVVGPSNIRTHLSHI